MVECWTRNRENLSLIPGLTITLGFLDINEGPSMEYQINGQTMVYSENKPLV